MSIIGLSMAGLSFICISAFGNPVDYESAMGWGYFSVFYLIAFSIVVLIKSKN